MHTATTPPSPGHELTVQQPRCTHTYADVRSPRQLDVCCVVVSHVVGCAQVVLRRMRHAVVSSIFRLCERLCVVVWSLE
jgi:hypothetical protein